VPTSILDHGIGWILWLQQAHPALDVPMSAITLLGEATTFALLILLLYWSLDRRLAVRLVLLLVITLAVNGWAKLILSEPRPFEYDPRVLALDSATGGGLPSGHTQNAVVIWGYLALWVRRRWSTALAVFCLLAVPLSRLYLGMHFPTDLLGGYLLGAAILWAFRRAEPAAVRGLDGAGLPWRIALTVLAPALLLLSLGGLESVAPLAALVVLGAGLGYHLLWPPAREDIRGTALQRALRFLVGLGACGALVPLLPVLPAPAALPGWALLGLWAAVGVPWLFVRLGLARARPLPRLRSAR